MNNIGRVCIYVEINDKPCAVALPHDSLLMLVNLASSLSDNGKLPVVALPDNFKFEVLPKVKEQPMNDYITYTVNLQQLTKELEDNLRDGKMAEATEIADKIKHHIPGLQYWLWEKEVQK